MIYLPIDDFSSYSCYSVLDKDTIRAYNSTPQIGNNSYDDYFINSHYLKKSGSETFIISSSMPVCINSENLTNEVYYRNDFTSILLMFVLLALICFYFPTRLIFLLFKKRGNI